MISILYVYCFVNSINGTCSCGRVVKASDSKSDSLWERRFESYQLRLSFFNINSTNSGTGSWIFIQFT